MALTNAEKQARYRERHLENGTKTRGHFFLEATTKAKLLRGASQKLQRACVVRRPGRKR